MSTTSPNFNLVLATSSDTVSVTSHLANNFSTLDTLLGVVHTGSGQLKSGLQIAQPTLTSPTVTGVMAGNFSVTASNGVFNTITATGGLLTVNSFTIGTYAFPATLGAPSQYLAVQTGNVVFTAPAPNTGANLTLNNLASVAINTNLNTFSAGFVTINRVLATSGALTGLTVFQASTGTFAGNLVVTGTVTASVINCTGGTITAGGITIGTWSIPGTIASTGVMRSLSSTATWYAPTMLVQTAFCFTTLTVTQITAGAGAVIPIFANEIYDLGNNAVNGVFTAPASGVYEFSLGVNITPVNATVGTMEVGVIIATTRYAVYMNAAVASMNINGGINAVGSIINTVASGATVSVYATGNGFNGNPTWGSQGVGFFNGKRMYEF